MTVRVRVRVRVRVSSPLPLHSRGVLPNKARDSHLQASHRAILSVCRLGIRVEGCRLAVRSLQVIDGEHLL